MKILIFITLNMMFLSLTYSSECTDLVSTSDGYTYSQKLACAGITTLIQLECVKTVNASPVGLPSAQIKACQDIQNETQLKCVTDVKSFFGDVATSTIKSCADHYKTSL